MSAAAFKKVLELPDDDELSRNERLLNLREIDCEIKERELALAEHLKDLEAREAALNQRKKDIAAELQYELAMELEKVTKHEAEVLARRDALEAEVKTREDALARREILIAEREWTLRAKEDRPKGVMGEVFANLEALGKENDKNVQTNRTHLDNTSTSAMPLFVENQLFVGSVAEETAWLNARIDEMQKRLAVINPPAPVRLPRPPNLRPRRHQHKDPELRVLADQAEDLRQHLHAARLKTDLASIMKKVDEAVADVAEMNARGEAEEARMRAEAIARVEYAAAADRAEASQNSEYWAEMASKPESSQAEVPPPPVTLGAQHMLFPPTLRASETPPTPAEMAERIAQESQLVTAKVKVFQAKMEGRMTPPSGPVSPDAARGTADIRGYFSSVEGAEADVRGGGKSAVQETSPTS